MSASSAPQQPQPQPQPQPQSQPTAEEAAAAAASAISSAFPAPPPFYKSFTPINIALLAARDASHLTAEESFSSTVEGGGGGGGGGEEVEEAAAAAAVVGELAHLIPPLPPQDGKYRSFGILHDISTKTESATPRTPPSPQRLQSITQSILLTFLSLVHCLAVDPAGYAFKWDELHVLFQEAHAVINEYRPHQARETLIVMMEEQVKRAREEGRGAREMVEKVKTVLMGLAQGDGDGERDLGREEGKEEGEERRVWEVVGREVGYV